MAQSGSGKVLGDTYVTSVRSDEYFYTWIVNNFSTWLENVKGRQTSTKFPSGDQEQVKWILAFYQKSIEDEEFCSLGVELVSGPKGKLNSTIEFTMTNGSGNLIVQRSTTHELAAGENWGWPSFIQRKVLLERVKPKYDKLIIKCKITANLTIVNETLPKPAERLASSWVKDLKSLFDDKLGDVTILVAGQRFVAHKCILSARCSVFKAMFEHRMQESIENCVSIDDVQPEVFKELLRYICTDEVAGLDTMVHDLYKAADKYDIPGLKSLCRCHILEKLSWETGAKTLIDAELYGDLEMKKHVLQFLSGPVAAKVIETEGWKEMVRVYPHLVDETIKALAAKTANRD